MYRILITFFLILVIHEKPVFVPNIVFRQALSGVSLPEQQRQIVGFAQRRFAGETVEMFVEEGVSGSIEFGKRPQGAALLTRLRHGDTLIILKLDRAFRNTGDALYTLNRLKHFGVRLFLLDLGEEDITADNSTGMLIFTILAAVAEFDRIAERMRDRIAQARLQGKAISSHAPFGWCIAADKTLIPIPEEQQAIADICGYYDIGFGLVAIARMMSERGFRMGSKKVQGVLLRTRGVGYSENPRHQEWRPKFGYLRQAERLIENPAEQQAISRINELFAEGIDDKAILARFAAQNDIKIPPDIVRRLRRDYSKTASAHTIRVRQGRASFGWVSQVDGSLVEDEFMPALRQLQAAGASLVELYDFLAARGIKTSPQSIMRALKR
jgi:DNA invertase Pin-like site-specific DNA recombinase